MRAQCSRWEVRRARPSTDGPEFKLSARARKTLLHALALHFSQGGPIPASAHERSTREVMGYLLWPGPLPERVLVGIVPFPLLLSHSKPSRGRLGRNMGNHSKK